MVLPKFHIQVFAAAALRALHMKEMDQFCRHLNLNIVITF
jgi:hypothetical protein